MRKRVYTTSDTPGYIVAAIVRPKECGDPVVKLLRQDGRSKGEYSLTNKKKGTIFPTGETAADAAIKYCKLRGDVECFVLPVGERETNRVAIK